MSYKWPDGNYDVQTVIDAVDNDFESEKELCDYIEYNIDLFTKDCLGYTYKSHAREYSLFSKTNDRRSIKGNRRIDFLISTQCGKNIGVECKRPTYKSELSAAIGQSLAYMSLFDSMDTKIDSMVLLSTKVDNVIPLVINKFNLPIKYICIDKKKHLTLLFHDK